MVNFKNPLSDPAEATRFWGALGHAAPPPREPTHDEVTSFSRVVGANDPLSVSLAAYQALQRLTGPSADGLFGGDRVASLWAGHKPPASPDEEMLPYDPAVAIRSFDSATSEKDKWVYEIGPDKGERRKYVITKIYDGLSVTRKGRTEDGEFLEVSFVSAHDQETIQTLTRLIPNNTERAEIDRVLEGLTFAPVTRRGTKYLIDWPPLGRMEAVLSLRKGEGPLPVATIGTWTEAMRAFLIADKPDAPEPGGRKSWFDYVLPRSPYSPEAVSLWLESVTSDGNGLQVHTIGPSRQRIVVVETEGGASVLKKVPQGESFTIELAMIGAAEEALVKLLLKDQLTPGEEASLDAALADRFCLVERVGEGYRLVHPVFGELAVKMVPLEGGKGIPLVEVDVLSRTYLEYFIFGRNIDAEPVGHFTPAGFHELVRRGSHRVIDVRGEKYLVLRMLPMFGFGLLTVRKGIVTFSYVYVSAHKAICLAIETALRTNGVIRSGRMAGKIRNLYHFDTSTFRKGTTLDDEGPGKTRWHFSLEGPVVSMTVADRGEEVPMERTTLFFLPPESNRIDIPAPLPHPNPAQTPSAPPPADSDDSAGDPYLGALSRFVEREGGTAAKFSEAWFVRLPPSNPHVFYAYDGAKKKLRKFAYLKPPSELGGIHLVLALGEDNFLRVITLPKKLYPTLLDAIGKTVELEPDPKTGLRLLEGEEAQKLVSEISQHPRLSLITERRGGRHFNLAGGITLKLKLHKGIIRAEFRAGQTSFPIDYDLPSPADESGSSLDLLLWDWFQTIIIKKHPGVFVSNGQPFFAAKNRNDEGSLTVVTVAPDGRLLIGSFANTSPLHGAEADARLFFEAILRAGETRVLRDYQMSGTIYSFEKDYYSFVFTQTDIAQAVPVSFHPLYFGVPREGKLVFKFHEGAIEISSTTKHRTFTFVIPEAIPRPVEERDEADEAGGEGEIPQRPAPRWIDEALDRFAAGSKRRDLGSISLERPTLGTKIGETFTAAEEPIPIDIQFIVPGLGGQSFRELKRQNVGTTGEALIWWGGNEATAIRYTLRVSGRGEFTLIPPAESGLSGDLKLIHGETPRLVIQDRASPLYRWLDSGLYGPQLAILFSPPPSMGGGEGEGGLCITLTLTLTLSHQGRGDNLFSRIEQIWRMGEEGNDWINVRIAQNGDRQELTVSYKQDDDRAIRSAQEERLGVMIDLTTAAYAESLSVKRTPVWVTEETQTYSKKLALPSGIDEGKSRELELRFTRRSRGEAILGMTLDSLSFRGSSSEAGEVELYINNRPVALPLEVSAGGDRQKIILARDTLEPPGREVLAVEIDPTGKPTMAGHQFYLRVESEGGEVSFERTKVEKRTAVVKLTDESTKGSPTAATPAEARFDLRLVRPLGGTTGSIILSALEVRGIDTSRDPDLTLDGNRLSLPATIPIDRLPKTVRLLRDSARGDTTGWEELEFSLSADGTVTLQSEKFIGQKEVTDEKIVEPRVAVAVGDTDDPFRLVLTLQQNPKRGLIVQTVGLLVDRDTARAVGLSPDSPVRTDFKLPQSAGDAFPSEFSFSFKLPALGQVTYRTRLARTPDGAIEVTATRAPLESLTILWDLNLPRLSLMAGRDGNYNAEFTLEGIDGPRGKRTFVRGIDRERILSLFRLAGAEMSYDPARHTAIEVIGQNGGSPIFLPTAKISGRFPMASLATLTLTLSPQGRGDIGTGPTEFLRIRPGEVFVPTSGTIRRISENCYREGIRNSVRFSAGSQYWYELEGTLSPIVLRLPVIWNPEREKHPWELDTSENLYVTVRGQAAETAIKLSNPRLRLYDNGGNWSIEFIPSEEERAIGLKPFKISAVVSPLTGLVFGGVNLLNEKENEDDAVAYRDDAKKMRDRTTADALARSLPPNLGLRLYGGRWEISNSKNFSVEFEGGFTLSGITGMASEQRVLLSPVFHLTGQGHSLNLVPFESPSGETDLIYLEEINEGETAREFKWFVNLGALLEEKKPSPVGGAVLADLLPDHYFPMAKPPMPGRIATRPVAIVPKIAIEIDHQIPVIPASDRGYAYPSGDLPSPPAGALAAIVASLNGETFFPDEEALRTQVSGNNAQTMVFVAGSGALLEIPVSRVEENGARYLFETASGTSYGQTRARMIVPDLSTPGKFFSLPVKVRPKTKGSTSDVELLVGDTQISILFERVMTKQTRSGRNAFGLFAIVDGKRLKEKRDQASIHLREGIEFAGLDDAESATSIDSLINIVELPDGRKLHIALSSQPVRVTNIQFERDDQGRILHAFILGEVGGKPMTYKVYRARNGAPIYFLKDENGGYLVLEIDQKTGNASLSKRPLGMRYFYQAPESRDFEMVGLQGNRYKSGKTSVARQLRIVSEDATATQFEIDAVLGRSDGSTPRTLTFEQGKNARVRFFVEVDKSGNVTVKPKGEIQEEGKGKKWQSADVDRIVLPDGRYIVYVRGQERRPGNFGDFAWLEFRTRDELVGNFNVSLAHYNKINSWLRQKLPSEAGFLGMLMGAIEFDPELVQAFKTKLPDAKRDELKGITETYADFAVVAGALAACGIEEPTWTLLFTKVEEGARKKWWIAFASMLQAGRELRGGNGNGGPAGHGGNGPGQREIRQRRRTPRSAPPTPEPAPVVTRESSREEGKILPLVTTTAVILSKMGRSDLAGLFLRRGSEIIQKMNLQRAVDSLRRIADRPEAIGSGLSEALRRIRREGKFIPMAIALFLIQKSRGDSLAALSKYLGLQTNGLAGHTPNLGILGGVPLQGAALRVLPLLR